MNVKREQLQDDDIPTLTERVEEDTTFADIERSWDALIREHLPDARSSAEHSQYDQPARSEFETTIEAMAAEILGRHMANAREEITRSILAEVRARLHGGRREKDNKTQVQ